MLSAYDLARLTSPEGGHSFGMDSKGTAAFLRDLADAIEQGTFVLQSGGVYTQAQIENYTMTVLNLKFHERQPGGKDPTLRQMLKEVVESDGPLPIQQLHGPESPSWPTLKELHGPDSPFPVDVVPELLCTNAEGGFVCGKPQSAHTAEAARGDVGMDHDFQP
jgi:hypothetical protein